MHCLLILLACKCSGGSRPEPTPPTDTQDSGTVDTGDSQRCEPEQEVCDGKDNDCDGEIDNDAVDIKTWYADADGDGYGDPDAEMQSCRPASGHVDNDLDCDDSNAAVWETCCALGSDGDFVVAASDQANLDSGTYSFKEFKIGKGAVLTLTGSQPVVIFADSVRIEGAVLLRGAQGAKSGGDAGPGGGGGGGGGSCESSSSSGGQPNGGAGSYTGGAGGAAYLSSSSAGGGGFSTWGGTGGGGGTIEGDNSIDVLLSGGGGGGGGGMYGAAGGGGGGALSITAGRIQINGVIDANGGAGGVSAYGSSSCSPLAAGGGGAGGMVRLHAYELSMSGKVLAEGGLATTVKASSQQGRDGDDGWIRISAGNLNISGTVSPGPYSDSSDPVCEL